MTDPVFPKGSKVVRFYTCEPAFIYSGGKQQEEGIVIGDPIEWDEHRWIPCKWEFNRCPDLTLEGNIVLAKQG